MRRLSVVVAVLALTACGGAKDEASPAAEAPAASSAAVAAADAAPAVLAQCKACHSVEPGKHGVGPSLAGVVGRKAGSQAGFAFSAAMKDSGLTWDDATLGDYLTAPARKVPGTKMSYAGLADSAKRAEVIAYLKTLN
jgi:cytochrome c